MKKRIWFNRWFNNAFYFINLIKNNEDHREFEVYGSHPNENTIVRLACDYFEIEPVLSGDDYINYCLDFCKRNKIDVFVPYSNLLLISSNVKLFEEYGTKVLINPDSYLMGIIMDKAKFYEHCKDSGIFTLPEYHIVNTASQFSNVFNELIKNGYRVCIKPVNSAGGSGFRVIDDSAFTLRSLLGDINHKISYNQVYDILSQQESFDDLMVMEYLDGFEYSIDCLAFDGKLLAAVPRKKVDSRVRSLENIPELIELAKQTEEAYKLPYIFNVQVKYSNSVPKLLEINPRMSGGLNASCFSGINFPYLAIQLLLNEKISVPKPILNIKTTKIENRFILK